MNCGTYTECKIKNWVFEQIGFLKISIVFNVFESVFVFLGVFVKEIVIFNIGFGFVVLKSIW